MLILLGILLRKDFILSFCSFYLFGIHTINVSSNLISAKFRVNNRLRNILEKMMMMQTKSNISNLIFMLYWWANFWKIISSYSFPVLISTRIKSNIFFPFPLRTIFSYLIRGFYEPERNLAPELKILTLFYHLQLNYLFLKFKGHFISLV